MENDVMTQPDLVSKLREVIGDMRTRSICYQGESNLPASLVIKFLSNYADELESLLGREGQAAPATVPQRKVDFCGAVCMAWEDCGDKEYTHHCVLQADHQGKHKFSCSQVAQPAPSPSTPIAPGTAGLSAETLQKLNELRGREAQIRKDVMEEAAQVCEQVARDPNLDYRDERCAEDICAEKIRALAERPCPGR